MASQPQEQQTPTTPPAAKAKPSGMPMTKFLILLITLCWPIAIFGMTFLDYVSATASLEQRGLALRDDSLLLAGLFWSKATFFTFLYFMAMVMLFVYRFAKQPDHVLPN